jgi:hypothetical protein
MTAPRWQKATASGPQGQCVEFAHSDTSMNVLIRDSKDPEGRVLRFSPEEISAFLDGVKRGEFDRYGIRP